MVHPRLPFLLRPYLSHELPGWSRLMSALHLDGIDNVNPRWKEAPKLQTRGKLHGYLMELDLSDDIERWVYFVRRFLDLDLQLLLDILLKPGDTFLDVGANVGMTTLFAASRVGLQGRVLSVEPQPSCCAKIRRNLELNQIRHVELNNVGLSDEPGLLTLHVLGGGTVMSTFAIGEGGHSNVREAISVQVFRGDDLFKDKIIGRLTIKIDVEGFELHVLRGLSATIDQHRPAVVTEVDPEFLQRAGVDADQLFDFFKERGYRGYMIELVRHHRKSSIGLRPVERASELGSHSDILWLPGGDGCLDPSPYLLR